jgi:hypothetical protein
MAGDLPPANPERLGSPMLLLSLELAWAGGTEERCFSYGIF